MKDLSSVLSFRKEVETGLLCLLDANENVSTSRKNMGENSSIHNPELKVGKDRWICVELIVKL